MCVGLAGCVSVDPGKELIPVSGECDTSHLEFVPVPVARKIAREDLQPARGLYRVGPGDELRIEVVEAPETSAKTLVMPDGFLYFNVAPGIQANGKTVAEIEAQLAESLRDVYQDPVVSVHPEKVGSQLYSVMGQVISPGVYDLSKPVTLLEALSQAGGLRSSEVGARAENLADLGRSVLLRNGNVMDVNFEALVEGGDMSQNVFMRPGDYLFVGAKGSQQCYVLGMVQRAGAVPYATDLTLIKALATAGGIQPTAFRHGLLLVRGIGQGCRPPEVARVDLMEIIHGRAKDFHLQPYDVIWVPKSPWKKIGEYAQIAVVSAISTIAVQEAAAAVGE